MNEKQLKIAIVAGFAVFSAALIIFIPKLLPPKEPTTVYYNGFEFKLIDNMWYTQWQHNGRIYNLPLRFNPYDVEDVIVAGRLNDSFNDNKDIYITFDPVQENHSSYKYLTLAVAELSLSLTKAFGKNIIGACAVNETEACIDRPIVNCDSAGLSVIYLKTAKTPAIFINQTCVMLFGTGFELLKPVDRFLYTWYEIIKPKNSTPESLTNTAKAP